MQSAESVALIERGGVVNRSRTPAMQLVKSGGVLMEFSNPNGIVFHEHGAVLGPGDVQLASYAGPAVLSRPEDHGEPRRRAVHLPGRAPA